MQTRHPVQGFRSSIDDLAALRIFVAVVEAGSFSEAGRRLRVVPSTISKQISNLEERIKGQLIARSTQRLAITELGRRFYDRCLIIMSEVEYAETEISDYKSEPQGLLKLTVPTVFATHYFGPILSTFANKYPKIGLDIMVTTEKLDLIEAGIDVAIRISSNLDPGLVAIKLAANMRVFCASPGYLERRGKPTRVEDLVDHDCILSRGHTHSNKWPAQQADGSVNYVLISAKHISDNGDLVRNALVDGFGIGYVARFLVHEDLISGRLVELFPEQRRTVSHIYAVCTLRRNMPAKTRVFLDHVREWFRTPPEWAR